MVAIERLSQEERVRQHLKADHQIDPDDMDLAKMLEVHEALHSHRHDLGRR